MLLTFPQTLSFFPHNGVVVGYPIRGAITPKPREDALKGLSFKIPANRRVVFAFGGSQGARTINRAVVSALKHLLPHRGEDLHHPRDGPSTGSMEYDAAGRYGTADPKGPVRNGKVPPGRFLLPAGLFPQHRGHLLGERSHRLPKRSGQPERNIRARRAGGFGSQGEPAGRPPGDERAGHEAL